MTTILAPATTADTSTADQIIETLAAYVDEHSCDTGGGHQNTMLLAALIVRLFDTPADQAIDLARNEPFDERVRAAGQARDEILARVEEARYAAEQAQAWTPARGDTVTWNNHDGIYTITGFEDDEHAWIRLQRDPAAPVTAAATFADYLVSTGAHFGPLVAIAALRPVIVAEVQA